MNVLLLNGSHSTSSIHADLLQLAERLLPDATVEQVSVRDHEAPLYSTDRQETDGVPETVRDLHARIQAADAVVIGSPEHNGMVTASLKNTLDWLSRTDGMQFLPKPLVLLSTSPGKGGGRTSLGHLEKLAPWWGADLVGAWSLSGFYDAFDRDAGQLRDPAAQAELAQLLQQLVARATSRVAA